MRLLYVLLLVQITVSGCLSRLSQKDEPIKDIRSVDILFGIRNPKNNSNNNLFRTHMGMVYYKEFILIKDYYHDYMSSSTSYMGDTPVVRFENPVEKYFYYVYDNSKKYFYRIDSLDINVKPRRIELDLDSLYGKKINLNFENLYKAMKNGLVKIDSSKINRNNKVYVYGTKEKLDASYNDSTFFYYKTDNEFNGIPFSFAKELDSGRRGKLFKIEIVYNENPKGITDYEKMEKVTTFEMKKVNEVNADTLRLFLDQFKAKYVDIKMD